MSYFEKVKIPTCFFDNLVGAEKRNKVDKKSAGNFDEKIPFSVRF